MPPPDLRIRPAEPADLDAVAGIYAHYVDHTVITFDTEAPRAAEWDRRLRAAREAGRPFLVGSVDGEVVGYALAGVWNPKPAYRFTVEDSVYLAPGATGAGHGRALLTTLLDALRAGGFARVVALIAAADSPSSVTLHRSLGFVPVGRLARVGWKQGRWVDVDVLDLDLTG